MKFSLASALRMSRCILPLGVVGLLALPLDANAATIQTVKYSGAAGNWSNPALWQGGLVPGASDIGFIPQLGNIMYDVNAPAMIGGTRGNANTLTLAKDLTIQSLNLRESTLVDQGFNVTVTGSLTNSSAGGSDGNAGYATRTGGNFFINNLRFGRSTSFLFVPGDSVAGNFETYPIGYAYPDFAVTQGQSGYGDALGQGLSLDGAAAIFTLARLNATCQSEITLNWDSGLTSAIDWTLRWRGDHVSQLTAYYNNGQIIIGTLPTGKAFSATDNIFYDATTDYTYVGFRGTPTSIQTVKYTVATGNWSNPLVWTGSVVPGAFDIGFIPNLGNITYDAAAPSAIRGVRGNALTLTLQKDLTIEGLNLREGTIVDQGFNVTVTGAFTNSSAGGSDGNGGWAARSGGNFFINNLRFGRASGFIFYPGDSVAGNFETYPIGTSYPDFSVTQSPNGYSDILDQGLSLDDADGSFFLARLNASAQSEITLNWDSDLTGDIDWTLRWAGDHVAELVTYYNKGQLIIGTVPSGEVFSPAANIFYDAATDYTYVGF